MIHWKSFLFDFAAFKDIFFTQEKRISQRFSLLFEPLKAAWEDIMNFLEERIMKDGIVKEGNVLKVDSFLNHQMDIDLFDQMGAEFKKRFAGKEITKSDD